LALNPVIARKIPVNKNHRKITKSDQSLAFNLETREAVFSRNRT
jgi:hypothetical protein